MRISLLILFAFLIAHTALPQKYVEPDKMKTFNIVVNYDTYTVKTQMLKDNKKVKVYNDLTYMWCSANKIIETRAGYDGKLIHGYYKSFYFENNQLRETGTVRYGLKNKEWRNWYADGKLKEVITYRHGKKNGKYYLYNDYGNLVAKGNFKNDLLNGNFYTYNNYGAIEDKKKYRHGSEVVAKPKKEKISEAKPAKEKKVKKGKATENTETTEPKKKKVKKSSSAEQQEASPAAKVKKPFGQKIKDFFKKKDKAPANAENKNPTGSV